MVLAKDDWKTATTTSQSSSSKIRKILRFIKNIVDKLFGTKVDEFYWRSRHLFDKNWARSYLSEESLNHPHRKLLVEKIAHYAPLQTVLEIGCAAGPNLYLLAKKFPKTKFYGVDISHQAIEIGKKWLVSQGIKNVNLAVAKADRLKQFENKSIDLIFTDAILIYIGPEKIERVLKEMLRVGRRALILNEWYSDSSISKYDGNHWVYNYPELFGKLVKNAKIKLTKIPESIWGGYWGKYGYLIEVDLRDVMVGDE